MAVVLYAPALALSQGKILCVHQYSQYLASTCKQYCISVYSLLLLLFLFLTVVLELFRKLSFGTFSRETAIILFCFESNDNKSATPNKCYINNNKNPTTNKRYINNNKSRGSVFLVAHSFGSLAHRFPFLRTNMLTHTYFQRDRDARPNKIRKFRKAKYPASLIRFLSATLIGAKVTSGNSVQALIG